MIAPIANHDREKISEILNNTGVFNTQEITVAMEMVDEALAKNNGGDCPVFCCHDDENRFVGYICFGAVPMTDFAYDLYWIVVDKNARRKGAATELVRFMEKRIAELGGEKIYVDTSSTSPYEAARAFYKRQGYSAVCVLDDFYRKGDNKIIFMKDITIK